MRRAIVFVVAAKVAGLVLLFDWSGKALDAVDLPKTLWSRGCEWLLVGLIVAALLRFGPGIIPRTWIHVFVLAYVFVVCLAAFMAADPYVALYGAPGRYLGLTFVLDMAVLYLAIAVAFKTIRDWATLAGFFALAWMGTTLYAMAQYLGQDPYPWTINPRDRPFGTLGNPDMFGHLLSASFGAFSGAAIVWRRRATVVAAGAATFALADLGLIAIVATRAAILGILGALVGILLLVVGQNRERLRVGGRPILAAVGVVAVAGLVLFASPLGSRVRSLISDDEAIRSRLVVYGGSFTAFADRPILGWGPDNIGVIWPQYRQPGSAQFSGPERTNNSAHDWVLQTLATTGVLGLVALLALLYVSHRNLLGGAMASHTIAGPLFVSSLAYWADGLASVGSVGVDWLPWVVFGAVAAMTGAPVPEPHGVPAVGAVVWLAPLLSAVVATTGINALRASQDALRASQAFDLKQVDVALEAGRAASTRDPGRADYWNQLGRALYLAKRWDDAAQAFDAAAARAPYESNYFDNLALTRLQQAAAGGEDARRRSAEAIEAAQKGVHADPNSAPPNATLAGIAFQLGQYDLAQDAIARAIALFPANHDYYDLQARAYLAQGRWADAETSALRGIDIENTVQLQLVRARALVELGRKEQARAVLDDILRRDPINSAARTLRQQIQE